jgi:hypothetical protein
MATKTLYLLGAAASGSSHGTLQDGGSAPAAALLGTGWVVGSNAIGQISEMLYGTERARTAGGGWGTTAHPTALGTTNAWRTANTLTGSFAAGNWTFTVGIRSTVGTVTRGRLRLRVYRSTNADGSGATELTSAVILTSALTALSTSATNTVTVTTALAAATLAGEYLFVACAWEITTSGSANTHNIRYYVGATTAVTTSDWTALVAPAAISDVAASMVGDVPRVTWTPATGATSHVVERRRTA